ncbi:urease accessory protein UreF [Lichenifustis flavocetrariae]|uniref:Urease accessory protein UreF n=1 Tax=Lichenifustis flavocetrariae TaxID=2949735 RepID=A0AA41YZ25_9HYPH|nr:urease accessory UreF family protein [Lichenifustis flavocetrariae]MCW6507450.1 urease accessory protein UreF [Lichenifustis flavocetrariae]
MFDTATALALLQYGDSAYPAGGFAFSWGIEGLAADGLLENARDLDDFVWEHLTLRWNSMDRVLLDRAYRAGDIAAIAAIDRDAEAATPSAPMREGSRRAGRALLGVSVRLGGALSVAYRTCLADAPHLGHLPVVQAVVYRDAGLAPQAAELVSGWTLVHGLVSAAVRLGVIGHVEAQRALQSARAVLAELLAEPMLPDALPSSFTPLIDIAVSRGKARPIRMFTT